MLNSLQPVKTLYRLDLDSVEFGNLQHSMRFGGQLKVEFVSFQIHKHHNTECCFLCYFTK
jgi:hypothetical protein